MSDIVNHPPHYKAPNGLEVIDVIEGFGLDQSFALGNAVKYLLRAGRKGAALEDLKKARWYLNRKIEQMTCGTNSDAPLYYLATPYTKYFADIEQAFMEAAALTAQLLVAGHRVYSPIAHTHPVAIYGNLDPLDHAIWLPFDEAMMAACDGLIVAQMQGWRDSYGVKHEIEYFTKAGKPVTYLDCVTLRLADNPNVLPNAVREITDDASHNLHSVIVP